MTDSGLSDLFRTFHPEEKQFTWHRPGSASCLDYILVSDLLLNYSVDSNIGLSFRSDHCPVHADFYTNRNPPGKNLFHFPSFLLQDEAFVKDLVEEIEQFVHLNAEDVDEEDKPSPALLWDCLKAHIRGVTIAYLSYLHKDRKARRKEVDQCLEDIAKLQRQRDWVANEYDRSQELTKLLEEAKAIFMEKAHSFNIKNVLFNVKRKNLFNNTSSKFFFQQVRGGIGAIRYMFNDRGNCLETDCEILHHVATFYDNLYGSNTVAFNLFSNFSVIPTDRIMSKRIGIA